MLVKNNSSLDESKKSGSIESWGSIGFAISHAASLTRKNLLCRNADDSKTQAYRMKNK